MFILLILIFFVFLFFKNQINNTNTESEKIYLPDGTHSFPFDQIKVVDDGTFEMIEQAYSEVDFYSEFKKGNENNYDFYKEKYRKLVTQEKPFFDNESKEICYLEELWHIKIDSEIHKYDPNNYVYYFFDIDEDDAPELCISDEVRFIYIFKYIKKSDRIILWYKMENTWLRLNGSKAIRWNYEGTRHEFYQLNKKGEEVITVSFFERIDYNEKLAQREVVYMTALPLYTKRHKNKGITEEIKNKAYTNSEDDERYYFRVTQEQYDALTEDYFKAEKLARENLKEVTYTYEELFGNE